MIKNKTKDMKNKTPFYLVMSFLLLTITVSAQTETKPVEENSLFSNGLFWIFLSIITFLLLIIIGLSEMVKAGAALEKERQKKNKGGEKIIGMLLLFAALPFAANSQTVEPVAAIEPPFNYWGLGAMTFYVLMTIVAVELLFIYLLYRSGIMLIRTEEMRAAAAQRSIMDSRIMISLTDAVPVSEEASIMTDHEYDGIRELDNNLPPWWKYGFYFTIVVAVVYLFHYHVLHTGKSSDQEYRMELQMAEKDLQEYRKTAANLVDETNVTFNNAPDNLSSGKTVYTANCVPCHGDLGEGKEGLGPNLTDDYWIHGGSIQDVFKSIKYGWTDKGMKSWQQDLRPNEIQQVASYIKSIRGTNPPNAREKQGDFYSETGASPVDSLKTDTVVKDSIPVPNK
jgi:cytochrome c oxidase cbb3-type subunit III